MTTYTPYPRVTIANTYVYSDNTLGNISINLGRRDLFEQPAASTASIDFWTDADTPLEVHLSDSIKVEIQNTSGVYSTIYYGTISDIDISLEGYGEIGTIARYSVTVVGILANLNKRLAGAAGYAKEFDGTRVLNILTEALLTNWTDVSPTLTWNQLPTEVTWATYDGAAATLVTNLSTNVVTPGTFELETYAGGSTNAWELAQDAAQSGRGMLYESNDGNLYYDDYAKRSTYSPITLTADDLLADGLHTAAQWSEIVNDVTVGYKSGGTAVARDEQSIILYGQLSGRRDTTLEKATDAASQAASYLASRSYPRMYPDELTIALHSPSVSNATRDALIGLKVSRSVTTSALPAVFGTNFTGFVEGITWRLTRYTAEISLTCSAYSETYPKTIWLQIPATTTWAGYNPTTKWNEL